MEKTVEQISDEFIRKYSDLAINVANELLSNAQDNLKIADDNNFHMHAIGLAAGDRNLWRKVVDHLNVYKKTLQKTNEK